MRGGGGVPMSHVDFKKWLCRPVEFKKGPCRRVEFKRRPCRPVEFKKVPCRLSLRPKHGCVAVSMLRVHTPSTYKICYISKSSSAVAICFKRHKRERTILQSIITMNFPLRLSA